MSISEPNLKRQGVTQGHWKWYVLYSYPL